MSRAKGPTYHVPFRRRREGKTNYRKRLALLKSGLPRLVARKTNTQVIAQVIVFDEKGDRTVIRVDRHVLAKKGWKHTKNIPTAYVTGVLLGKLAKEKGYDRLVLDMGLHTPTRGNFAFYVAKGAQDAGIEIKVPEDLDMDRVYKSSGKVKKEEVDSFVKSLLGEAK
ncbi:MAG: 50S ribosomal protein L18 [Candidatus Micrarchaeota archaeon]|nr:50S ribosomal protein L18 [Candidatus Micrarchaeota archaeon]